MGATLMKFVRVALISFLISSVSLFPTAIISADAASQAVANSSSSQPGGTSITTGSFVVIPTLTPLGSNVPGTPLTLSKSSGAQYFYVRNSGNLDVVQFSFSITYDVPSGAVALKRCDTGVSFSGPNTCNTGSATVISVNGGVVDLLLPPNSWVELEIDTKKKVTPTFSISVSSSQIRSPILTNS